MYTQIALFIEQFMAVSYHRQRHIRSSGWSTCEELFQLRLNDEAEQIIRDVSSFSI